ncbi:double-headed protease inhibitor, submandibular gland-like [Paroedura picta]|uniref:double-headed protease inhibitor, submandibular gland-like n=1 Tax=Paroedura picta TaxID=143630 RepID=UPI004056AB3F
MKIIAAFVILSLTTCFFCSDGEKLNWQEVCHGFPVPKKGGSLTCQGEKDPVCGSDGQTYNSKCHFCAANWKYGGSLTILYKGICKEDVICSEYPRTKKGEPVYCPQIYEPICASDGHTYDNPCLFCIARRKSGGTLTIRYADKCIEEALCSKYPAPKKGQPVSCPRSYDPICGSDGVTYYTHCIFCGAWRKNRASLTILHEGQCRGKGKY